MGTRGGDSGVRQAYICATNPGLRTSRMNGPVIGDLMISQVSK